MGGYIGQVNREKESRGHGVSVTHVSSPGLELETPSLVPVKKNASAVVVSDKYNLKPIPLKRQRYVLAS